MPTLTEPDDTGTLGRDAVQRAAPALQDSIGPSLADRAREPAAEPAPPPHADSALAAPADAVERPGLAKRSRWALVVAAWAAAVALLLPLVLLGILSAFDVTLDLDAPAPAEQGGAPVAEAEPEPGA